MNFRPQDMKARLLSPRVVIYLILLIAAVWLMRRFEKYQREAQATATPSPAVTAAAKPLPFRSPPDAALRAPAPRSPLMIVFTEGKDDSLEALANETKRHLKERCDVIVVRVEQDKAITDSFKLKQLPAAVLCDAANRELARQEGELTAVKLDALAAKLPE